MGQRANLVVIENGATDVYYDHWCANRLDTELLWGPDYAAAFARQRKSVPPGPLLDDVWCEGAALIDFDRKRLLWFGGEDVVWDVPRRRALLAMQRAVWRGWNVQWAHGGIADVAVALGRPLAEVLTSIPTGWGELGQSAGWPEDNSLVCTVLSGSSMRCWLVCPPVDAGLPDPDRFPPKVPEATLPIELNAGDVTGGVHLDVDRKILSFWWASYDPGIGQIVEGAGWPGHRIVWWRDRFEMHAALVPNLVFSVRDESLLCSELLLHAGRFINYQATDPAQATMAALTKRGFEGEIVGPTFETRGSVGDATKRDRTLADLRGRFTNSS